MILKAIGFYLNTLALFAPKKAGKAGFKLFCSARRPKLKEHQIAFLQTGKPTQFISNNVDVTCYTWGNGDTKVLFLHGWESHSFRWKRFIEKLDKQKFTLYALDAPAHGMSKGKMINVPIYANAILDFTKQVSEVDTLVCHSFGGFSSFYAINTFSNELSIKKLVSLGAPGEVVSYFKKFNGLLGLKESTLQLVKDYFITYIGRPIEYFTSDKLMSNSSIKGLIIQDREDKDVQYQYAVDLHKAWPNSELWITEGYGHKLTDPAIVARVEEFITSTA